MAIQIGSNGLLTRSAAGLSWSSAYDFQWLMNHRAAPGRGQGCWQLFDATSNGYDGLLFLADGKPYLYGWNGSTYQDATGPEAYTPNVWTRYRLLRESATSLKLFINDVEVAALTLDMSGRTTTDSTLFLSTSAADWLEADMAGLKVWTDAAGAPEFDSITPVRTTNLWAAYIFANGALDQDWSEADRDLTTGGTLAWTLDPLAAFPDTGAAADALAAQLAASLADAAGGSDTASGALASTLAESSSGSDALVSTGAGSGAESGSGADTASGLYAGAVADAGTGSDALNATAAAGLGDVGAGSDTAAGAYAATLAETGTGTDGISAGGDGSATVPDGGTGSDTASGGYAGTLADTGAGADVLQGGAAALLVESGAGDDALAAHQGGALVESGSGADAISALYAAVLTQQGTGADGIAIAPPLIPDTLPGSATTTARMPSATTAARVPAGAVSALPLPTAAITARAPSARVSLRAPSATVTLQGAA